jgi:hypothetical protein
MGRCDVVLGLSTDRFRSSLVVLAQKTALNCGVVTLLDRIGRM